MPMPPARERAAQDRVAEAATSAGLGAPTDKIVLTATKKILDAVLMLVIGAGLTAIAVVLLTNGLPNSFAGWSGLVLYVLLGPGLLYHALRDLVRALRGRGSVHLFEHGLVVVDARNRPRVFSWRSVLVRRRIHEIKKTRLSKTVYYRRHVYILTAPGGEQLRLDSEMCRDVITLGPRIIAAADHEQGL